VKIAPKCGIEEGNRETELFFLCIFHKELSTERKREYVNELDTLARVTLRAEEFWMFIDIFVYRQLIDMCERFGRENIKIDDDIEN
jgi:hypothetical protein